MLFQARPYALRLYEKKKRSDTVKCGCVVSGAEALTRGFLENLYENLEQNVIQVRFLCDLKDTLLHLAAFLEAILQEFS